MQTFGSALRLKVNYFGFRTVGESVTNRTFAACGPFSPFTSTNFTLAPVGFSSSKSGARSPRWISDVARGREPAVGRAFTTSGWKRGAGVGEGSGEGATSCAKAGFATNRANVETNARRLLSFWILKIKGSLDSQPTASALDRLRSDDQSPTAPHGRPCRRWDPATGAFGTSRNRDD